MARSLLPFKMEVVDDESTVTAYAGLPLVMEAMRVLGVSDQLDAELGIRQRDNGATDAQKSEALVLLMASGGTSLSDINKLRADRGLQRLLGAELVTDQVLWNFLNEFHDEALIEKAKQQRGPRDIAYIPDENRPLRSLGRVNVGLVHEVATRNQIHKATLDHDATVIESHNSRPWPTTRMAAAINRRSSIGWKPIRSLAMSSVMATCLQG